MAIPEVPCTIIWHRGVASPDDRSYHLRGIRETALAGAAAGVAADPESGGVLARVLQTGEEPNKIEAAQALSVIGEPAVSALIHGLKYPSVQVPVSSVLGRLGPPAKDAIPALLWVVGNGKAEARREALMARKQELEQEEVELKASVLQYKNDRAQLEEQKEELEQAMRREEGARLEGSP